MSELLVILLMVHQSSLLKEIVNTVQFQRPGLLEGVDDHMPVFARKPAVYGVPHLLRRFVVHRGKLGINRMTEPALCDSKVLIPSRISPKLFLGELRNALTIDRDELVLVIKQFHELALPLPVLFQAEEDEVAIAVDVVHNAIRVEALADGRFHLANCAQSRRVQVDKSSAFAMHDEVAMLNLFLGNLDEFVN